MKQRNPPLLEAALAGALSVAFVTAPRAAAGELDGTWEVVTVTEEGGEPIDVREQMKLGDLDVVWSQLVWVVEGSQLTISISNLSRASKDHGYEGCFATGSTTIVLGDGELTSPGLSVRGASTVWTETVTDTKTYTNRREPQCYIRAASGTYRYELISKDELELTWEGATMTMTRLEGYTGENIDFEAKIAEVEGK